MPSLSDNDDENEEGAALRQVRPVQPVAWAIFLSSLYHSLNLTIFKKGVFKTTQRTGLISTAPNWFENPRV